MGWATFLPIWCLWGFSSRLMGRDAPSDNATLTFDILTSPPSAHFGLPRPFRSRVRSKHATDRQRDRQTDRHRASFYNAPSYGSRGNNYYYYHQDRMQSTHGYRPKIHIKIYINRTIKSTIGLTISSSIQS